MKDSSKRIALAGIGSAISLIFVVLSFYVEAITLSMNVLAAGGLFLPLSQKYYREALLSFVVVSLLGLLIVNIGVIPFVLVGGSYTIFTIFWENKEFNYYKSLPIKIAYSVFVFFILYSIVSYISLDINNITFLKSVDKTLLYILLNLAFSILFVIYDRLLIYIYRYFRDRIIKRIVK